MAAGHAWRSTGARETIGERRPSCIVPEWIGGHISYTIDALVADGDTVAAVWTGTLPSGATMQGLSLYNAAGGLLRWTRHALIGDLPR